MFLLNLKRLCELATGLECREHHHNKDKDSVSYRKIYPWELWAVNIEPLLGLFVSKNHSIYYHHPLEPQIWSPLHTICLYLRTMTKPLFSEKIWILRNTQNRVYRQFIIGSSFCQQHANLFGATKNAFVFHSKTVPSSEDSAESKMKNLFMKHQQKYSTQCLCFVAFSFVYPFFCSYWIVCSELESSVNHLDMIPQNHPRLFRTFFGFDSIRNQN